MNFPPPAVTPAITVDRLGKRFKIYDRPWQRAAEWLDGRSRHREVWALRDLSFQVGNGRCLGIIGANGSGKSTLLKILTGVMLPTIGTVSSIGRTLALLELGTGFNPDLTGRENVFVSTSLLGFPPGYAADRIADIAAFADIGEYFDHPVRLYSSGMFVRLAFSVFLFMEPAIFIIDEALSVGDLRFQQKCAEAMRRIRAAGTTLVLVSHDLAAVQDMCDEAILLKHGAIAYAGKPAETIAFYHADARTPARGGAPSYPPPPAPDSPATVAAGAGDDDDAGRLEATIAAIRADNILGSGSAVAGAGGLRLAAVRVVDEQGRPAHLVRLGQMVTIEAVVEAHAAVAEPNFGVGLVDRFGRPVFECGCRNHHVPLAPVTPGTIFILSARLRASVAPGEYTLLVSVGDSAGHPPNTGTVHDRHMGLGPLTVTWNEPWLPFYGFADLETHFAELGRVDGPLGVG